jgi:hypothetical protein
LKKTGAEKLWKTNSNPNLLKTTLIEGNIYTTHRIRSPPTHRCHRGRRRQGKAGESGGRTAIASESPLCYCFEDSGRDRT